MGKDDCILLAAGLRSPSAILVGDVALLGLKRCIIVVSMIYFTVIRKPKRYTIYINV